jgi:hypothetical protein
MGFNGWIAALSLAIQSSKDMNEEQYEYDQSKISCPYQTPGAYTQKDKRHV